MSNITDPLLNEKFQKGCKSLFFHLIWVALAVMLVCIGLGYLICIAISKYN